MSAGVGFLAYDDFRGMYEFAQALKVIFLAPGASDPDPDSEVTPGVSYPARRRKEDATERPRLLSMGPGFKA